MEFYCQHYLNNSHLSNDCLSEENLSLSCQGEHTLMQSTLFDYEGEKIYESHSHSLLHVPGASIIQPN